RCKFSRARSPMRSYTPSIESFGERTLRAGGLLSSFLVRGGWGKRNPPSRGSALELWEDRPGEQLDVLAGQRVGHASELEQAHDAAGAERLHWRLDFGGHVVGIAHEGEPLPLRELELELVERDVLGGLDHCGPRRRRLAHELHRAPMVGQELLPEVVEV